MLSIPIAPNMGQPSAAQKNDQYDLQTVEMYYNNISSCSIESIVESYLSCCQIQDGRMAAGSKVRYLDMQ